MKLNIKKVGIAAVIGLTLIGNSGCTKWLVDKDVDPSNYSPDTYYKSADQALSALAAVYAQTRFIYGGAGIFASNFSMLEMVTGTARTETGQNADLNNILGLSYNGDNVFVNNWWNGPYSLIAQANLVLQKVPGVPAMDEAVKKKYLGEASFLRAWAYFYLVRLYGDVPLITEPVDGTSPQLYPSRTPVAAVYDAIVADLISAEASGLDMADQTGHASMGAVKSLLAEVYLTMAGAPLNKGVEYYQKAAAKAKEVIDSKSFKLFSNYNDLHSLSTENKDEHIFEIQFLGGVANNDIQGILLPNFKDVSAYGTEIGSTVPSVAFYNTYEAGDLRKVDRQGFFYTSYYTGGDGALKDLGAPYIYKFFDVVANGTSGTAGTAVSGLNMPNIRYAQVLLTYAEAQNQADGTPNQQALDGLTAIRTRAGLTTAALGSFSKQSFDDAVLKERWHEMCYEGVTWFDMLRRRKAYNFATKGFDNFVGYKLVESGAVLGDKNLLFPLPTSEMQNNPNLKPNNPGY